MAKLCACFIFFLLFALIMRPEIHAVEARLLFKNQIRILSSEEVLEPARSGPSPGAGHEFGPKEDSKRSTDLIVTGYSGPSPGIGHAFGRKEDSKRTDLVITGNSGPSPGVGHGFDPKDESKRTDHLVVTGNSVPSPGVGHRTYYGKGTLITGIKNSGPSPGEGHKQVPAQSLDENKS